jgi:hypothetical protein
MLTPGLRHTIPLLFTCPFLQAKARKAIIRQKRAAAEAVLHPDELQDIHEEEKQETDRNMENMWRQLKRVTPGSSVCLTHLVCNHSSFAQTVENIFTLSFLVRVTAAEDSCCCCGGGAMCGMKCAS